MIYPKLTLFLTLFVISVSVSFGDVYSWKDENGVMHFTDTPPPEKAVKDDQLNVMKTAKGSFYHRYYKKDGDDEYCGSQRMNSYDEDPRTELINAYYNAESAYKNKKFHRKEYSRLLSEETKIYARTGNSIKFGGRNSIEKRIGECDCKIAWTENKIAELTPYIDIILNEAEVAKQDYQDAQPDCGEKPSGGWHTDQAAIDWYNCMAESRRRGDEKRKRKRSRSADSTKESLLRAIKAYNAVK